ncbi:hypothetical protein TSUD_334400 [Trifolium subterraneum]|uniref:F-box domain-containing protein n=1 Tax=Trifolium subterraneum TaxID=3900 RepID=A0A2Z6MD07_TRISU|nr:hypothetical protein TSUD_334400 [Trifolium subterraneum]
MNNRSKKIKIQLPDSILSQIFSKLGLKDLVKTSTLSKLWRHEWQLRTDLNFDLSNMFDKVQELPKSFLLLQGFQSEFVTRLDQFMLHYQGAMIDSIRVKCPLSYEHSDVIGRLIWKGITKGAKRIELLFAYEKNDDTRGFVLGLKPCIFSFDILSGTDTLTYLHLQNCRLAQPVDFSGLKNLRTLVLQVVAVRQNRLEGLFSNCIYLVDFTLDACEFESNLKIISPTLLHLNIVNCKVGILKKKIDIIASNLSSIEYSCNGYFVHKMNIDAPILSKFSFRGCQLYKPVGFFGLKNVATIVIDGLCEFQPTNIIPLLFSQCFQLEDVTFINFKHIPDLNITSPNLRHLKIIECSPLSIDINALNLASFEYSCHTRRNANISVTAPMLSRVFWNAAKREKNPHPFGPITSLQHIENLAMIISTSQVSHSKTMFAS